MRAITFDFYNTLAHNGTGRGRGARFHEYLGAVGLEADPWEHVVLYDLFGHYGDAYDPRLPEPDKHAFWVEFTRRLFARTRVSGPAAEDHAGHATVVREIMGSSCLVLYDDALPTLRAVREAVPRVGIVSDWPGGLAHFCEELGIRSFVDTIVASADVGFEKPDPRLFEIARERLGVAASDVLHVGDCAVDVEGARAAGFSAVLLVRDGEPPLADVRVIASLRELPSLV